MKVNKNKCTSSKIAVFRSEEQIYIITDIAKYKTDHQCSYSQLDAKPQYY